MSEPLGLGSALGRSTEEEIIARARAGDQDAFAQLVVLFRRELEVHCYRILGSLQDAEDAVQDIVLAAWQRLDSFEGRSSIRPWLYRMATNRCLDMLRSRKRRIAGNEVPAPEVEDPTSRVGEVLWLEPYPDNLLDGVMDTAPGPDARYESREAISLAFVKALQLLPPRQRASLILRDVLGFRASEAAEILESTEESVTSALKRARAALRLHHSASDDAPPPAANSEAERDLTARFVDAFESQNVPAIVALLTEDVSLTMPPLPFEYRGRERATGFLSAFTVRQGERPRLVETRANRQPALGVYIQDPRAMVFRGIGLLVLGLAGDGIGAMTHFPKSNLPQFGLPRILLDESET
jgi:RNA polymerase sigma-70 factor (TIGR02960 family)